jgi:hypothetical protein
VRIAEETVVALADAKLISYLSTCRGDMAVAVLNGRLYAVGGEENDATTCFVTPIQNVEVRNGFDYQVQL